jgi:hypothetical protein
MNRQIFSLIALVLLTLALSPLIIKAADSATISNPLSANNFTALLTNIATAVGTLIATLGVIMLIVAGIFYLTSAGNPERISTAKKALIYAIAGIVIGLAANAIVSIIQQTLGVTGA